MVKDKDTKKKREQEIFDRYKKNQRKSQSDQEYYDDLIKKKKEREGVTPAWVALLTSGLVVLGFNFLPVGFQKTKDFALNQYQEFNQKKEDNISTEYDEDICSDPKLSAFDFNYLCTDGLGNRIDRNKNRPSKKNKRTEKLISPIAAQSEIDQKVHKMCLPAADYKGCVEAQKVGLFQNLSKTTKKKKLEPTSLVVEDIEKKCEGSNDYNYCVMMWKKINQANKPLTYAEEMTVGFWLGRSCFYMYGTGKGKISSYKEGKEFVRDLLISEGLDPSLANREDLLDKATNEIIKKGKDACYGRQ